MNAHLCENHQTCRLVNASDFKIDKDAKASYLTDYCNRPKDIWANCKRFVTKTELHFCPDFVMPDTTMTSDEIVDKFDSDENLQ